MFNPGTTRWVPRPWSVCGLEAPAQSLSMRAHAAGCALAEVMTRGRLTRRAWRRVESETLSRDCWRALASTTSMMVDPCRASHSIG